MKWRTKAKWFLRMNSPQKREKCITQADLVGRVRSTCTKSAVLKFAWLILRSESLKKCILNILSRYKNNVCIFGCIIHRQERDFERGLYCPRWSKFLKCNRCFSRNAPCADSFYSHQHFSAVERVSIARRIKGKSPLRASNKETIQR